MTFNSDCHAYFFLILPRPQPTPTLFPYTTLFRSLGSFWHGSMANAMAQAIGAQAVYPGRQVISLSGDGGLDRKSTRLNSSHVAISYAVFCLKKKIVFVGPA